MGKPVPALDTRPAPLDDFLAGVYRLYLRWAATRAVGMGIQCASFVELAAMFEIKRLGPESRDYLFDVLTSVDLQHVRFLRERNSNKDTKYA